MVGICASDEILLGQVEDLSSSMSLMLREKQEAADATGADQQLDDHGHSHVLGNESQEESLN
jgi:hypothetical protein